MIKKFDDSDRNKGFSYVESSAGLHLFRGIIFRDVTKLEFDDVRILAASGVFNICRIV